MRMGHSLCSQLQEWRDVTSRYICDVSSVLHVVTFSLLQCIGTPRQGLLVPSSRAIIHLDKNMSPEALDGLDNFRWVLL